MEDFPILNPAFAAPVAALSPADRTPSIEGPVFPA